jgi:hypothetical protein
VNTTGKLFHPFVGRNKQKMGRHSIITKADILRAVRILRWSTRYILVLFFGRGEKRIKAIERFLPLLETEGKIFSEWHKGEKVYSIARKKKVKPVSIEHEITCALILVVFWRCRMAESEIVPERAFRRFDIVPESALRYSETRGTMLAFEYCTRSNFKHGGVMKSKITRYLKNLSRMEATFQREITVLFVIDIDRQKVRDFVLRVSRRFVGSEISVSGGFEERGVGSVGDVPSPLYGGDRFPLDPFFFTDLQSIKDVMERHENLMKARIYFWHDGNEWSLSKND